MTQMVPTILKRRRPISDPPRRAGRRRSPRKAISIVNPLIRTRRSHLSAAGLFPPIIEPADLMASETQLSGAGDRDEAATPQPRRHRDHRLDAGSDDTAGDPPPRRGPRFYSVVGVIALITIGSAAILATQGGSDPRCASDRCRERSWRQRPGRG